jgi:hypothetical protein
MKARDGYFLIKSEDLSWRPSNLMKIPDADFLERTGSGNLGAPGQIEFLSRAKTKPDLALLYPVDPK